MAFFHMEFRYNGRQFAVGRFPEWNIHVSGLRQRKLVYVGTAMSYGSFDLSDLADWKKNPAPLIKPSQLTQKWHT